MSMAEQVRNNLNSILLCVTLGVLGWLGVTTQGTAVNVARISVAFDAMSKDMDRSEKQIALIEARVSLLERQLDKVMPK